MNDGVLHQIYMLIDRKRYGLAHEKITELLGIMPDAWELHTMRAQVYLQEDKYEEAREAAGEAIALNPECGFAFLLISQAYLEQSKLEEAERAIEKALEIDPSEPDYYAVKSNLYVAKRKYQQAISCAEEGLALDPEHLMLNNLMSLAQRRLGQKSEAFERMSDMMGRDPENPLTHANMGYHHLQSGDHKKAKEHFAMALSKDPEFDFARMGMIQAMKASNIMYAKLLQFAFWMDKIGQRNRWLFIIGLLVIVNVVPVLGPFYLIFILWTWFTTPLSDIILYFDKYGKYLMTPSTMRLTQINIGLLIASLVALGMAFALSTSFLLLAFACFLAIVPVYMIDTHRKPHSKWIVGGFAVGFVGIGLYGVFQALGTGEAPFAQWNAMIIGAIAFSWISSVLD